MNLTRSELLEAAAAVNMPPFTGNAVLAAKLRAEAERVGDTDTDHRPLSEVVAELREIGKTVDWGPDPIGDIIRNRQNEDRPPAGPDGQSPDSWARCTP